MYYTILAVPSIHHIYIISILLGPLLIYIYIYIYISIYIYLSLYKDLSPPLYLSLSLSMHVRIKTDSICMHIMCYSVNHSLQARNCVVKFIVGLVTALP